MVSGSLCSILWAMDVVFDIMDILHKHPLSAGEELDHVYALWDVPLTL